MKICYTECVMVQQDESPIYGAARIIIRVDDRAGGPYLVIRGDNNEAQDGETEHDFFLQSEEEIDQFAEVCKSMLRQAKAADDPAPMATTESKGVTKMGQAQTEINHAIPRNEPSSTSDLPPSLAGL